MDNHIQAKDIEKRENEKAVEEVVEKSMETPESPESIERRKVIKKRIERVKKAFKPTWLVRDLNSQDSKKGK